MATPSTTGCSRHTRHYTHAGGHVGALEYNRLIYLPNHRMYLWGCGASLPRTTIVVWRSVTIVSLVTDPTYTPRLAPKPTPSTNNSERAYTDAAAPKPSVLPEIGRVVPCPLPRCPPPPVVLQGIPQMQLRVRVPPPQQQLVVPQR